jgi:L-fuconolactonase
VVDLAGGYGRWLDAAQSCLADLPSADRAKVFGLNAARFYGI